MRIKILILLLMASTHVAAIFSGAVLHERLLPTSRSAFPTPHSESALARTERLAQAGDTKSAFALASRYLIGDAWQKMPH